MRDPADIEKIAELEAQVKRLTDRLGELTGADGSHERLRRFGLQPRAAKMLVLMARQYPSVLGRTALNEVLNSKSQDLKSIDVIVCKTRRKLEKHHIPGKIETLHGQGYRTDGTLTAWVLSAIGMSVDPQPNLL